MQFAKQMEIERNQMKSKQVEILNHVALADFARDLFWKS